MQYMYDTTSYFHEGYNNVDMTTYEECIRREWDLVEAGEECLVD